MSFLRNIYDENERAADVDNIILKSDRSNIAKLRICAHNLEIEKGRCFQINTFLIELKEFVKYAMI